MHLVIGIIYFCPYLTQQQITFRIHPPIEFVKVHKRKCLEYILSLPVDSAQPAGPFLCGVLHVLLAPARLVNWKLLIACSGCEC